MDLFLDKALCKQRTYSPRVDTVLDFFLDKALYKQHTYGPRASTVLDSFLDKALYKQRTYGPRVGCRGRVLSVDDSAGAHWFSTHCNVSIICLKTGGHSFIMFSRMLVRIYVLLILFSGCRGWGNVPLA